MKFYDLFGGVGGFRLGLENASDKFECVGYCDNDKFAVKSYNQMFGENHEPKDATKLRSEGLPDFDLLCAGFPCQSFSIAGKRKAFEDTRGTLFFEIARIAKAEKPSLLLLENVKGLLSSDDGKTFATILKSLDELGYFVEWQVLNSKHFGVPQNRERVFVVGHLGGEPERKVFPLGGEDGGDTRENGGEGGMTHNSVTNALGRSGSSKEYLRSLKKVNIFQPIDDYNQNFTDIFGAVRQTNASEAPRNGVKLKQGTRIRKLTPKECWRLQGFPDWAFEKAREVNSDTQLYKQAGNAVTVNVIEALGRKLEEAKK